MASVFIRHRVADFAKWKPYFDDHESTRREGGATAHSLHRDTEDPNMVTIALKVKDISRAKEFTRSDELRSVMQKAGVQGPPEIWYTEDLEDKSY
jgi:hypothetical protein